MIKAIPGYESYYSIYMDGRVYSHEREYYTGHKGGGVMKAIKKPSFLKPGIAGNGYKTVALCKNGKAKTFTIHRLIAEAFIPNQENKKEVNHIDGNRQNNDISNLEWVTPSENMKHRYIRYSHSKETIEKIISPRRKRVLNVKTNEVYISISDAAIRTGRKRTTLINQLNQVYKNTSGLVFI